jgi:uncharacterized protein (TIGR02594 family)
MIPMLPVAYVDLAKEKAPKMLLEMLRIYGTLETPGSADNAVIMAWAQQTGIKGYVHDSVPWCGLTMAVVAHRAGYEFPENPLWALNWLNFGRPVPIPMLGDIMVKSRQGGGHVTMYVGVDNTHYHCLGGNQSDSVNITRIPKTSFKGFRRPVFKIGQPKEVRVIWRSPKGAPAGGSEA